MNCYNAAMKKVYLIGTPGHPTIAATIERVSAEIATYFEITGINCDGSAPPMDTEADFIMVFGGDGTILGAAHSLEGREIPLIGINLGTLGFMTEASLDELPQALRRLAENSFIVVKRNLLQWQAEVKGRLHSGYGLNELVVRRCNESPIFSSEVRIDGSNLTSYRGDGLLIATATGSTAYNLAAQGPILESSLPAFIITPLHPHSLTHRPLVVSDERVIEVEPQLNGSAVEICIDGRETILIDSNTTITIRKTERKVRVIELSMHSHYEKIRAKLSWGL